MISVREQARGAPRASATIRVNVLHAATLTVLLLIGLFFRLRYARDISLFVDEFTTMWAAKRILEFGVPIMPSGVLYTRGILASYVEAAFLAVDFTPFVARLPNILFGLATIVTIYLVGRRQFDARVGLVAAALVTLAPEEIIWSSRARFYMQLQLFVLLAAWSAYESIVDEGERSRLQALFAILFVLALFSQEETVLLYPAIVLAALLWRGVRFFRRPAVLVAHAVCIASMALRYVIEKVGQPGYFETIQAQRPYVRLGLDVVGALDRYSAFFVAPERIPILLLVLVAAVVAIRALVNTKGPTRSVRQLVVRGSRRLQQLSPPAQATLYYLLLFGAIFGVIVLFVGKTWREMRYIFFLVPFWFLPAGAGAIWLLDQVTKRAWIRDLGAVVLAAVGVLLFVPAAQTAVTTQVEGYDLALQYVAEHRQPGDVVLTPQPPSCTIILGPCDYYAIQKEYEEYVIKRDGVWVDRWSGAPLLNTVEGLRDVIAAHPHTYFIIDGYRLATRYTPEFVRTVIEQMDVVFMDRGIAVLRAAGLRDMPAWSIRYAFDPPISFDGQIGLTRAELSTTRVAPGESLNVMLMWTGIGFTADDYNAFVHVVGPDGRQVAQHDGPPVKGIVPVWLFGRGQHPDLHHVEIPPNTPPGLYRVRVGLYDLETLERLPVVDRDGEEVGTTWTVDYVRIGPPPSEPPVSVDATFDAGMRLVARNELPTQIEPGETLDLTLGWRTETELTYNYTVFVQLLGPDGSLVAQDDRQPKDGFYPTSVWDVDELVTDTYTLTLPDDAPIGTYHLITGLYRPDTGERLLLSDGRDAVELKTIEVVPQ